MAERLTGKDIRNTTILKVDKDNMRIYNTTTEDGEEETVISCDAITKLGKLEDIMERLGINFVEDLEDEIKSLRVDKYVYKKDRDTWKRACELAIRDPDSFHCPNPPEYYNAQDEYGSDEPFYIQDSVCDFADTPSECLECRLKYFYQQAKNMEDNIEKNNCNTDN